MNNYLVKLTVVINGYEKTTHTIVQATDRDAAMTEACIAETHNLDYAGVDDSDGYWWDDGMVYKPHEPKMLTDTEYALLKNLL